MNYPKIRSAIPLPDYFVLITFDNGKVGILDMKTKMHEEVYQPLVDKSLFDKLKTDSGGYGISWNDEIDLSEVECAQLCQFDSVFFLSNGSFQTLNTAHSVQITEKLRSLLISFLQL